MGRGVRYTPQRRALAAWRRPGPRRFRKSFPAGEQSTESCGVEWPGGAARAPPGGSAVGGGQLSAKAPPPRAQPAGGERGWAAAPAPQEPQREPGGWGRPSPRAPAPRLPAHNRGALTGSRGTLRAARSRLRRYAPSPGAASARPSAPSPARRCPIPAVPALAPGPTGRRGQPAPLASARLFGWLETPCPAP